MPMIGFMNQKISGAANRRMSSLANVLRGQRGGLLVELVAVMAAFGVLGTAVLSGVQTSHASKRIFDVQSEAENIARNEMENAFAQAYLPPGQTYTFTTTPNGFLVTAVALAFSATSSDISLVRVPVERDGRTLKVLETHRAKR